MCSPVVRHLAVLITLALTALPAALAADRDPPRARELRRLRVLLAIDSNTDREMAASVNQDRAHMQALLEENVPAARLHVDHLDGRKVTREAILKYYRELKAAPDEALLFFYAGHGTIDPKLGHCLQPQMGKTPLVPRAEIRKAMEDRGAGLVVLLTDCCSTYLPTKPVFMSRQPPPRVELHPVLRCLFFQHRGTVDITAAEEGMGAYSDDQHGGVFTRALVGLLEGELNNLDRDGDGFVSWKEFFPQLTEETEKKFKDFADQQRADGKTLDQKTQRPHHFSLPAAEARKTYAVVSIRNDSGKAFRYRYRWAGEREWKVATVSRRGKVYHELAVADGGRLPDLVIEAESGRERGKAALHSAKWTGVGRPGYRDGKEYNVGAR
jgi:hypothetical protein